MANTISEMIAPQVTEQDALVVEVFGEKSQAVDNSLKRITGDVFDLMKEGLPRVADALSTMVSGSGEIYDKEGNVIGYGGGVPDLAFSPLASIGKLLGKKNIVKTLRALSSRKLYPDIVKPSKLDAPALKSLEKKGLDPMGMISGKPTIFGKLVENRAKKRLYKNLSTKKEFKKFKNTYGSEQTYKDYNKMLKDNIFGNKGDIEYKIGERFLGHGNVKALGGYDSIKDKVILASSRNVPEIGTTLSHELMHKMHSKVTDKYTSPAYKGLEQFLKKNIKPDTSELLKVAVGTPTETLARIGQLKSKGIVQSLSEAFGVSSKPRLELEQIYSKKFIDELMNKYWAAAPVGALGTEMKLRDNQ